MKTKKAAKRASPAPLFYQRRSRLAVAVTGCGFVFLYLPLIILVIYSFNASRNVAIWSGFSVKWYLQIIHDQQLLQALLTSLKVAIASASIASIIGGLAGYVLARHGNFRSRGLLNSMIAIPLIIPEVILGLAALILFVNLAQWINWPGERGALTIIIAHSTVAASFVAVIVRATLSNLTPDFEEAAQDLGATPVIAFVLITLPTIAPALVAGWLLAFTISFDDLIIASFASGPGASTLPMVVFSRIRLGVSPIINALATLLILTVTCVVITTVIMLNNLVNSSPANKNEFAE